MEYKSASGAAPGVDTTPSIPAVILHGLAIGGLLGTGGYATARLIDYLSEKLKPSEPELNFPIHIKTSSWFTDEPNWWRSAALGASIPVGAWGGFEIIRSLVDSYEKKKLAAEIRRKQLELAERVGAIKTSEFQKEAFDWNKWLIDPVNKWVINPASETWESTKEGLSPWWNTHGLLTGGGLGLSIPVTYLLLNKLYGKRQIETPSDTDITLVPGL